MHGESKMVVYQHHRGGLYEYLYSAINVDNNQPVVVYRSLDTDTIYVRNGLDFHKKFKRISPAEKV